MSGAPAKTSPEKVRRCSGRRSFLCATTALAASFALPGRGASGPLTVGLSATGRTVDLHLIAAERKMCVPPQDGPSVDVWTFADGPQPVIRIRRGDRLRTLIENRLDQFITVHWHGLRIANAMDGVPFMTQAPIEPGQSFTYDFIPPDTGTFFFHTHCNTIEQLGRGLSGVLIVEGDEVVPHDADLVLVLRDWRIDADGKFTAFTSQKAAAKAGTFGQVRTINDRCQPVYDVPAGGDVRLRLLNIDPTRIMDLGLEGAPAAVIAIDGNGLTPFPLESRRLGPAMRMDLSVRAPAPGDEATLYDYFSAEPVPLARLRGTGPGMAGRPFRPRELIRAAFPVPDLDHAETMRLTLQASAIASDLVLPDGQALRYADALCLSRATHWAIDRKSWPEGGHQALPPPLFEFAHGKSYVIELVNDSQYQHPMHLHGVTFQVLDPKQGEVGQRADTVLLSPRDRVRIAFVADNPGDWMLHCHIIEHQETGMMGWFRVA